VFFFSFCQFCDVKIGETFQKKGKKMEFTPAPPPKKTLMLFFLIPFFLFGPCLGLTGFYLPPPKFCDIENLAKFFSQNWQM